MLIKLKNVCKEFIVPQRNKPKVFDGNIPWCRIEDIEHKYISKSLSDKCVSEKTVKEMNYRIYPINTVLFSCSATIGKVAIVKKPLITNQTFIGIVCDDSKLSYNYLYYYLKINKDNIANCGIGSTIKYISRESFEEYEIDLPSLEIQDKITNILSNIDNQIECNNAMTKRLQDMILTRYSIMFQNKKSKNALLKDICLLPSGYNFKPESYNDYGKYKLITIKNVCDTFVDDTNTDKLSEVPNIKDYCYLSVGDILLSLTGNVGRISIVHSKDNLLNQRVSLLQTKENYKIYSYCLLKSQEYQFIMTNIARGTSQKNLSPIDVENLKVYAPTFEEIKAFNENTENYFNEMLIIKQSTDKLITLKEKLLPLLINGQLNI